jgi:hypothetical protein
MLNLKHNRVTRRNQLEALKRDRYNTLCWAYYPLARGPAASKWHAHEMRAFAGVSMFDRCNAVNG